MEAIQVEKRSRAKNKKEEIPEYLIYEIMDGKPIYRKGYRDVINKNKTLEEIMACSGVQSDILDYLLDILYTRIGRKNYKFYSKETGVHIEHKNNLSSDLAIYLKSVLTGDKITTKYVNVPAKIYLEIDLKAELEDTTETGYIYKKSQKLLRFGAEKIIWILTQPKWIIVASKDGKYEIKDWNQDVELLENQSFNIGKYLEEEGIKLD